MIKNEHMNEECNFLPDRIKTAELTGLSHKEIKRLLVDFSHSEIRTGKYVSGKFIPGDFLESLYLKKMTSKIPLFG